MKWAWNHRQSICERVVYAFLTKLYLVVGGYLRKHRQDTCTPECSTRTNVSQFLFSLKLMQLSYSLGGGKLLTANGFYTASTITRH